MNAACGVPEQISAAMAVLHLVSTIVLNVYCSSDYPYDASGYILFQWKLSLWIWGKENIRLPGTKA